MININLITVGSLKERYFTEACNEYQKRLGAFCKLKITELPQARLPENPSEREIQKALEAEGERILESAEKCSKIIAMCIEGKKVTSKGFSEIIESCALSGNSSIAFVIGSSFGLCETVKSRANIKISFSDMTFPHQLFRVLLLEQIYRGFQIAKNAKYHK